MAMVDWHRPKGQDLRVKSSSGIFPHMPPRATKWQLFWARIFGKKVVSSYQGPSIFTVVTGYQWRGKRYVESVKLDMPNAPIMMPQTFFEPFDDLKKQMIEAGDAALNDVTDGEAGDG